MLTKVYKNKNIHTMHNASFSLYQSYINAFATKVFLVSLITFKLIIASAFIDQLEN